MPDALGVNPRLLLLRVGGHAGGGGGVLLVFAVEGAVGSNS